MNMEDAASKRGSGPGTAPLFTGTGDPEDDVDLILRLANACPGKVLELMCSTLRIALPLARAGREVHCVENHPEMIKRARTELAAQPPDIAARITLFKKDIRDLRLKQRYGFIYMAGNGFLCLLNGFDQVLALRSVKELLLPGGKFLIDVFQPDPVGMHEECGSLDVIQPSGDTVVKYVSGRYDTEARRVRLVYHYDVYSKSDGYRNMEVPFDLRYMEHSDFLELFKKTGFGVKEVYGDHGRGPLDLGSPRMIYILENSTGGDGGR